MATPPQCGPIEAQVQSLEASVRRLQEELRRAAPGEKAQLVAEIRELTADTCD